MTVILFYFFIKSSGHWLQACQFLSNENHVRDLNDSISQS